MFCDLIADSCVSIIKNLLTTTDKKYIQENIHYGELNQSINYNQILSAILEKFDEAIWKILESESSENIEKIISDCFLKDGKIYDYIVTSGIFDKYAKLYGIKECPISSITGDQKIIIENNQDIKTSRLPLSKVQKYYTEINPICV